MRDPDEWEAEFFHPDGYLYYHEGDKRQSTTIASLIREAQEDGARAEREACIERERMQAVKVHALEEKVQMLRERHRIAREVLAGEKVLSDFKENIS